MTASQEEWRLVRRRMTEQRTGLARAAAADYPALTIIGATDLLVRPEWLPAVPIPLDDVAVQWRPDIPGLVSTRSPSQPTCPPLQ